MALVHGPRASLGAIQLVDRLAHRCEVGDGERAQLVEAPRHVAGVVVEGRVVEVGDRAELEQVANTYESKYGTRFTAPEGTWFGLSDAIRAGKALVYRVTPTTILGFAKGEQFSQTRWRFG